MASTEAVVTSRLTNDLLTCLKCNQLAEDPRMLPCVHIFCLKCLESRGADENRNPGEQMSCPACQSLFDIPIEGFSALQRDFFVDKLKRFIEILTPSACEGCSEGENELAATQMARNFCVQCQQKLCECCCKTHRRSKLYMNHRLFDLDNHEMHNELAQQLVTVFCEKHEEEHLKLYCVPCKQILCATCYIEAHQTHDRKSASDVASQFRDLIRAELDRLETPLTKLSEDKEALDEEHEEIARNLSKIKNEISKREDEVKKAVQFHAILVLFNAEAKGEAKRKVNEKPKMEINTRLIRLRSFNRYCEEMILRGSDSDVCTAAQQLIRKGEDLLEEHRTRAVTWQPQTMTLYFKETDIGEFLRPAGRNIIGRIQDDTEQQLQVLSSTDIEIQQLRTRIFVLELKIEKETTCVENLRKINDKLNQVMKIESGLKETLQTKNKELTEKLNSENLRCSQLISELNKKIESGNNQQTFISALHNQLRTERGETAKLESTIEELSQDLEKERSSLNLLNVQKDELFGEVQNLKLIQSTEKRRWLSEETKFRETIKELQQISERTKQSAEKEQKELKQIHVDCMKQLRTQHDLTDMLSDRVKDFERKELKWKANESEINKRIHDLKLLNVQKDELSKEVQNLKLTQSTEKKRWLTEETKLRETIKDLQQTLERTKQSTEKTEKELKEEIVNFRIQLHVQHEVVHHLSSCVNDFEMKELKLKANENKLNKRINELENVFAPEEYSRGARNLGNILYKQRPAEVDYEQASFSSVIRRKYSTSGHITGIAVTEGRLFVASQGSSTIETFDSETFDFIGLFKVEGLVDPVDMKGFNNGFLYILDGKTVNSSKEIIKVNSVFYKSLTRWSTGWDSGLLSITKEGNVILSVSGKAELKEYNSDGVLVHQIKVSIIEQYVRSAGDMIHAVKLNTGHYLVSYKLTANKLQGICVLDEVGRMFKSDQSIEYLPMYLTTDNLGSIMVAEHHSGRVIQLNSTLDYKRDLISWPDRYPGLLRVQVNDSTEPKLFVSYQDPLSGESVIRVFNVGPNRIQRCLKAIFRHFDYNLPENATTRAFVRAIRTWTTSDTAIAFDRFMSRALEVLMLCMTLLLLNVLFVVSVEYLRKPHEENYYWGSRY